jgi:hypothetical protein
VAAKNFDEWFNSLNVSMSQSRKHLLFLAWEAATDALEDNFKSHNTGRVEMPPACGNCPIGVRKCEAIYGQQSCHATLWRHFART